MPGIYSSGPKEFYEEILKKIENLPEVKLRIIIQNFEQKNIFCRWFHKGLPTETGAEYQAAEITLTKRGILEDNSLISKIRESNLMRLLREY